jgi:hypothetical protein
LKQQNKEQASRNAEKGENIKRFLDKLEQEMRDQKTTFPNSRGPARPKVDFVYCEQTRKSNSGTKSSFCAPPPKPNNATRHSSGVPPAKQHLLVKQQWNKNVSALGDEDLEAALHLMMQDPRTDAFYVLESLPEQE